MTITDEFGSEWTVLDSVPADDPWYVEDESEGLGDFAEETWSDDVEADADTLASAGWGTDEDYGYYSEEPPF